MVTRTARVRSLASHVAVAIALALSLQIAHAGSLSSVAPAGASAGVAIAITGLGFDSTAANNTITFTPAQGAAVTATGTSIVTLDAGSGLRRLSVTVPAGLPAGTTALRVVNGKTGEASAGQSLEVLTLSLPAVASGAPGATNVAVRITGSPNVRFVAGSTRAAFGVGITVASTNVESSTSLVATISIAASAAIGPRDVSVLTNTQTARLAGGFAVAAPPQNHAPVANAGGPYTGTAGLPVSFTGSATDADNDPLTFTWDFGDGSTPPGTGATPSHTFIQPDDYTVHLSVSDGRGGTSTTTAGVHVAPKNLPPIVSAGGSQTITLPDGASLGGTVADDGLPLGGTLTAQWTQVSGRGKAAFAAPASAATTVTFDAPGAYVLRLTGNDSLLTASGDVTITVNPQPNRSPQGHVTAPPTATAGAPVQFDATGSIDPDHDALSFSWDFGDQTSASGPSPTHVYQTAGAFTVTLTVDDGKGGVDIQTLQLQVSPAGIGRGFITGRVLADADGLPLQGAVVDFRSVDANTGPFDQPKALTDEGGRFRVVSPVGTARLAISKDGYTTVDRAVAVVDGKRVDPFDARLTPIDGKATTVTSVLGSIATNAAGDIRLTIPAGALDADASVRLTRVSGQGLVGPLPAGWSPAVSVDVAPGARPMRGATLSVPAPFNIPSDSALLARWDESAGAWIAAAAVTRSADNGSLQATLSQTGQYAFVVPDPAPAGPVRPPVGQPLAAASVTASDATVLITPSPKILFANSSAHSQVRVIATPSGEMTSGTPLRLDVAENYSLSGGSLFVTRTPRSLALYRFSPALPTGGAPGPLESRFVASPSRLFGPFQLQHGTIDLAARLPTDGASGYGALLPGGAGQFTASTGERVVLSADAGADDLPVALSRIDPADLPPIVPPGLSVIGAAELDLHGASLSRPAVLSIPIPVGFQSGAQVLVLRITEVAGLSHPELVATALVQGSSLATSIDPLGTGELRFPGIQREGWYIFAQPNQAVGFVTGIATAADGSPIAGGLVAGGALGLAAVTGADGRYTIAAAAGAATFTTTNVATGDETTFSAQVIASAVAAQSVSVGQTPFAIASVAPTDGSSNVALGASIRVIASTLIDPASIANAVSLTAGGNAVSGTLSLSSDGRTLVFRPGTLLASNTSYQIVVGGGLRGANGQPLAVPATTHFATVNLAPPPVPAAGAVSATIPDATNVSRISGSQGTSEPGGLVLILNLRTRAITTLTPNADGSFTGSVTALRSDHLQLTLQSAAGTTTTVPLPAFRNADGSVVIGTAGGHVDGPAGTFADVPAGALPDGTVVKVDAAQLADFGLDAPAGFPFAGGLRLDLGGAKSTQEIHVGIQAPAGATPADQVLLVMPVALPLRRAWTVIDRAHLVGDRYVSQSPPFPGVSGAGSYGFLKTDPTGCISYVTVKFNFNNAFLMADLGMPFFYPTDIFFEQVTLPKVCNQQLTVQVLNPNTEAEVMAAALLSPAAKDDILTTPDILTDDTSVPTIVSVNSPNGQAASELQIVFSKAMQPDVVQQNFAVHDGRGRTVAGTIELDETSTIVTFRPATPFLLGEHYSIVLFGLADKSGNLIDAQPLTFTPFEPRSLALLSQNDTAPSPSPMTKCSASGCSPAATDVAFIGHTLFVANGLRSAQEQYAQPANPERLLAYDVSDPFHPQQIGFDATTTNPRALATIENASFVSQPGGTIFNGNLLLVAGGGRVPAGDLSGELAVYDVTRCTQTVHVGNCLTGALKGFKLLSTAQDAAPLDGVPQETGVPLQVAALHQKGTAPNSDVTLAYVVVAGVGLEAVDVTTTFNLTTPNTSRAPDALLRGDYLDVGVMKNKVVATGRDSSTNEFKLSMFTGQLGHLIDIPPPPPPGLSALAGAARVGTAEDVVFDVDGDGRLGPAEDADQDPTTALQELFDLAIVSSGPITAGCPNDAPPCGELYIVDLSSQTDLAHSGGPRILDVIPLPGSPFSVQVDPNARLAYVEIRGRGVAIVDLNYLLGVIRGSSGPLGFTDRNGDGVDDRVLRIVATGTGQNDISMARLKVDVNRGIAYISGSSTGVQLLQIANEANELALDFNIGPSSTRPTYAQEKSDLESVIAGAVDALRAALGTTVKLAVLEQGSGACFWRDTFPTGCKAFQPGVSDHDLEFFVPQTLVTDAQAALNRYIDTDPKGLSALADVSMFAMPVEPFQNAELLNGTPLYKKGDTTGDLGMGRQTLLLLWTLDGEYVTGYQGELPDLSEILNRLQHKADPDNPDPIFPIGSNPEPSGIPRVEGYEWSLLQEFNFYKTGSRLRIAGACDNQSPVTPVADRAKQRSKTAPIADANGESFLGADCREQIHSVAKAGIRTVLARMLANNAANPMILQVDRTTTVVPIDRAAFRATACFNFSTPSFNPAPPTDADSDRWKGCDGFEEFIATTAFEAAARGRVFTAQDLPLIYQFWCLKVDCDPTLIQTDAAADGFLTAAIAFIEKAQIETRPMYVATLRNDTKRIGDIPYLPAGPVNDDGSASPGIANICLQAIASPPSGPNVPDLSVATMLPNETVSAIDSGSFRKYLRLCNAILVAKKTYGDGTSQGSGLRYFQLDTGSDAIAAQKKSLGAKNYAAKDLQVRALNLGSRTVAPDLTMYEGDGVDPSTYTEQRTLPVALNGGDRRVIKEIDNPDDPADPLAAFPVVLNLTAAEIAPDLGGQPRAIAFFLDPQRTIPEANKKDNQAAFVYYVLNRNSSSPPAAPAPPDAASTDPDPLAVPTPQLQFTVRLTARDVVAGYGGKDVAIPVYQSVQVRYRVVNLGPTKLQNVEIARVDGSRVRQIVVIPELAPAGQTNASQTFTDPQEFTPTEPGVYAVRATARGRDTNGNTIGPENDLAYVTANETAETFDVKLFDASPLAAADHPFTRIATNTASDGSSLPLVGAVTDGDSLTDVVPGGTAEGGGHIRISIDGLKPDRPATILVADAELSGVTDGVGTLTPQHTLTTTLQPDITGHATVDYFPPSVFVREAHRADDFSKIERIAKVTVAQTGYGSTTRRIRLRRPPVFLVHGLFATRGRVDLLRAGWDNFQPLVPPTGVAPHDSGASVPGFDGRFDVFAVGKDFPSEPFATLAPMLRNDIKAALARYLPGFALGKIDVVGHSMGGLLISKLAHEEPRIAAAIRKLITLDSPFGGSALADKLAEIRSTNPIKEIDLEQEAQSGIDPLAPTKSVLGLPPGMKVKVKLDWCATIVRALGWTPAADLGGGALDDLRTGSAELTQLTNVLVPSHRVALETNTLNLLSIAPSHSIDGLWAGMGLLCGITPDASTVEWTQNLINAKQIISTLLDMKDALEEQGAKRLKGLLEVLKSTLQEGVQQLLQPDEPPSPIFSSENDRIVDGPSQLAGFPSGEFGTSTTTVAGDVDHSSVHSSAGIQPAACLNGNDFLDPPVKPDVNGDGTRDVVCHVMRLLEADPSLNPAPPATRLFFKNQ
jgi:PKD repeat protein